MINVSDDDSNQTVGIIIFTTPTYTHVSQTLDMTLICYGTMKS